MRELDGVRRADDLVPNGERRVPERIQKRFGKRSSLLGADEARADHHDDIGVASQRHRSPAEAADGRHGESTRRHSGHLRGRVESGGETSVEKARVGAPEGHSVLARGEPLHQ